MAKKIKVKETEISIGDTIRVHHKIKEDDKIRTQIFEGVLIAIKGHRPNRSFTVRKIASGGIGVEMIWPVLSPALEKVEIKKKGDVRRAKLYYLRDRVGKRAVKVKEKTNEKKESGKSGGKHSPKKTEK